MKFCLQLLAFVIIEIPAHGPTYVHFPQYEGLNLEEIDKELLSQSPKSNKEILCLLTRQAFLTQKTF